MFNEKVLTLYNSIVQKHSRTPQNQPPINLITHQASATNKFCGDEVELNLKYDHNDLVFSELQLIAKGCSINVASSSILSTLIICLKFDQIIMLRRIFEKMLTGKQLVDSETKSLGDLIYFQPLSQIQIRKKCALLVWKSIENIQPIESI